MSVIAALRWSLFGWVGHGRITYELMQKLHRRLGVISAGMERLMARFLAGKPMRRATRVAPEVAVVEDEEVAPRARAESVWPADFSWLPTLMEHRASVYTAQLELLLAEPGMVALLTACPQAVRLLRPMCRMLGVTQALLRPGVAVVVKPAREPKPRIRKKRPPIDWGRIPLPRGVLSAARRAGFKPVR